LYTVKAGWRDGQKGGSKERRKRKRDFSSQKTLGGAEVSLRRPTLSQDRKRKKIRRLAPFEMTGWCVWQVKRQSARLARF
jgi:hypothetical protein